MKCPSESTESLTSRLIYGKYLEMFYKCCSSSALFCTFLSIMIQDDCKRRTLFRVFRGHVVFEGIHFFLRCRFSVLFGWTLACHFLGRVHGIFLFPRCRERKTFFMRLREFVVQFKTWKNLRLTKKTLLFVFYSLKGDNGFENILKWHCRKSFLQLLC